MALVISLNPQTPFYGDFIKLPYKTLGINSLKSVSRIRSHHWSSSISIKTPTWKHRLSVLNKSDSDSHQIDQQDEEVNDFGVKAALSVLRFYKREISPILPRSCRYVPTCSEYSMIAYKKYGFYKGTVLTAWRLCRCNPLGGSGFDPPRWFDEEMPPEE
ncbi:UPF0161 protein At3g09310 [Euphorbia lathyris]|uniref:UPF0161 protein At3g09310 n=1 Tax=Euphorbia lathyris TaxID=212925 RepID=UPI0033133D53